MARAAARTPTPIEGLAARFRERVARSRRQLAWGALLLAVTLAALIGRSGTALTRLGGAALLGAAVWGLVLVLVRARRTLADRRRLIEATLLQARPEVGARALRALSLVQRAETAEGQASGESPDLAQLHFQRMLALTPPAVLDDWAARVSHRARLSLLVMVVVAGTAFALDPARVFEGLNVLVARGGRAPFPMYWLGSLRVESHPPAYLREPDRAILPSGVVHEAAGSMIVVQGLPEREGRKLVLVGGDKEVPFVSDGAGGVLARWALTAPVELRVAARFGNVLITEPDVLELRPVADVAPSVDLEGAPRSVLLKDLQALELRYAVSDDHGLREVALVLRAGGREDRRTLERLDGEAKRHTGVQALSPRDAFLRRSFLPVEVSIEARDNDGVSGAKWGVSQAITVLPPGIGEGEALRYAALKAARAALVKAYAAALVSADTAASKTAGPRPAGANAKKQDELVKAALEPLRDFVDGSYAGLSVPKTLKTFLLGQSRALERPAPTRETFLRRLEDVTLAVDAALRATGDHDAEGVAKRLGDVAEEVADASKLGQDPEKQRTANKRLEVSLPVLRQGASSLLTLSALGADLGSVAGGEINRIRRGLDAKSYVDAELAARHLAARLRRPKPSFSSADSGGVESGGQSGRGGAAQPGEASQAHQQFQELMRELAQLSAEHAGELSAVESALQAAEQSQQDPELEREAKERAEALRRALEGLPDYAPGQTPAEQAAALAREHGRAMAESLSRLALKDAKQSADSARQQLSGASKAGDGNVSPQALTSAEQELVKQQAFVEELLKKAQEAADARAKEALERSGKREGELAERAQNLSGRGSHGEAALPGEVAEALDKAEGLMRDAARELSNGRGEQGLSLQREAQRWLDQESDDGKSDEKKDDAPQDSQDDRTGNDKGVRQDAEVPGRDKNLRAEDFRKRVLEGLSRDQSGRLGPAVKRYAEGLLK
ncbi:MAG TPA: DUF4175 domain-containing protein [Polyangiaceae bacterium]